MFTVQFNLNFKTCHCFRYLILSWFRVESSHLILVVFYCLVFVFVSYHKIRLQTRPLSSMIMLLSMTEWGKLEIFWIDWINGNWATAKQLSWMNCSYKKIKKKKKPPKKMDCKLLILLCLNFQRKGHSIILSQNDSWKNTIISMCCQSIIEELLTRWYVASEVKEVFGITDTF